MNTATYEAKHDYLIKNFSLVDPVDFYRTIFTPGSLEPSGSDKDTGGNGIVTKIDPETHKAFNLIVFDDLEVIKEVQGLPFVVMPPCTYFGKRRTAANATELRAFAIDLDGVGLPQIKNLFFQIENKILPKPTFVVNSGHGVHLYYVLAEPVRLYPRLQQPLNDFKAALTDLVWNAYTSTIKKKQIQPVYQAFRMPGTLSKFGAGYPVEAFKTGDMVFLTDLASFLKGEVKITQKTLEAVKEQDHGLRLSRREAKELYPEWYERKISNPAIGGKCNKTDALYQWWLRKIQLGATYGHRYHCISILAACAVKCGVSKKQLTADARALLPLFNSLSEDNPFTEKDLKDALKMYKPSYANYSRKAMERNSGIAIPANKRNGRTRKQHQEYRRKQKKVKIEMGENNWDTGGRPTVEHIVKEWRALNPAGSKNRCIKETGLSKPTVYKWWDSI